MLKLSFFAARKTAFCAAKGDALLLNESETTLKKTPLPRKSSFALRLSFFLAALAFLPTLLPTARSQDAAKKTDDKVKPIRALLITGGCCHDYEHQKVILTEGTNARANIEWVIAHERDSGTKKKIPLYEKEDWANTTALQNPHPAA